jgi:hypothetical protein
MGGYLHESILVFQSLRSKYVRHEQFKGLNDLACGAEFSVQREILKRMRNVMAFHLDSEDKSTEHALKSFKQKKYTMRVNTTATMLDVYYPLVDDVDIYHVIEGLKIDSSHEDKARLIAETLNMFLDKIAKEVYEFTNFLYGKCEIHRYID